MQGRPKTPGMIQMAAPLPSGRMMDTIVTVVTVVHLLPLALKTPQAVVVGTRSLMSLIQRLNCQVASIARANLSIGTLLWKSLKAW